MAFSDLGLSGKVLQAVESSGYTEPTPIQAEAIPHVLARRDVLGIAQTGTGKTAAFTLPMLTLLETGRARARMPRTLILEPTRELAAQVEESFTKYGAQHKLNVALLIGGVSFGDQDAKITRGVDVLIATPGRLLDHFERGKLLLSGIEVLVIDEADRMLDMGFIPDIERICKMVPFTRQTLFFSATMPPEIQKLVDSFLSNPVRIEVARASSTARTITQLAVASGAESHQKRETLRRLIRGAEDLKNGIIFCNRKRDIAVVLRSLQKHGFSIAALHGDMDQRSRMQALDSFRNNEVQLLIASDVAARGLDIPDVSHVFNYDAPHHAEDYVHRIGRTGRAGRKGTAYTIITPDDAKNVAAIEAMTGNAFEWLGQSIDELDLGDSGERPSHDRGSDRRRGRDRDGRDRKGRGRDGRQAERVAAQDPAAAEQPRLQEAPARSRSVSRPEQQAEGRTGPRQDQQRNEGRNGHGRDDRRGRNGRHDRDEPSPIGFGDHIPAFMLTAPRLSRSAATGADQTSPRDAGPVKPDTLELEPVTGTEAAAPVAAGSAAPQGERRNRRRRDRRRDRNVAPGPVEATEQADAAQQLPETEPAAVAEAHQAPAETPVAEVLAPPDAQQQVEEPPETAAVDAESEKPRRRRSSRRKPKAAADEAVASDAAEAAPVEAYAAATAEPVDAGEQTLTQPAEPEAPRTTARTRSRRKKAEPAEAPVEAAAGAAPELAAEPAEAAAEAAAPAPRKRTARRKAVAGPAAAEAPEGASAAVEQPAETSAEEAAAAEATGSKTPRVGRTRTRRAARSRTAASFQGEAPASEDVD